MGGVYRIQTFFGFLYFFYIYKAPKMIGNKSAYVLCIIIVNIINAICLHWFEHINQTEQ